MGSDIGVGRSVLPTNFLFSTSRLLYMGGSRGWAGWALAHPKNWSKEKSNMRILQYLTKQQHVQCSTH